jgi:hypothetical protein
MTLELYTKQELIDIIKAIDLELNGGLKRSELDTTTDRQEFELDVTELRKQRDYYYKLLQQKEDNGGGIVTLEPFAGPFG